MIWGGLAGVAAGLVLGFLGAGGTVIAIPILLGGTHIDAHIVLGTNALGVALTACALFIWRYREYRSGLHSTIVFLLPGIAGIYAGTGLGLAYPGRKLIYLLGILLFFVAAWILYTSMSTVGSNSTDASTTEKADRFQRPWMMIIAGFAIGMTAGFFGIGGGFMIVPALMFLGGMTIELAAIMALLPIGIFALAIGTRYLVAGAVILPWSGSMALCGLAGGAVGRWLSLQLPRVVIQRIFALLLVSIGIYFIVK